MSSSLLAVALRRYRILGAVEFSRLVLTKLASRTVRKLRLTKFDVARHYEFISDRSFGPQPSQMSADRRTLNWVIPDFNTGSGGHINIFRLVRFCELAGFVCRIVIVGATARTSATVAREEIREHFSMIEAKVFIGEQNMPAAEITIATSWITAYSVRNFLGSHHKAYFVQDYEPFFFAHGTDFFLAQHTYQMGLFGITAGDWLARKLSVEHGMEVVSMGFSYDRELYRQLPRKDKNAPRVFFYARPVTPRRCFELGLLALQQVAKAKPDVQFTLAGWETSQYEIGFQHLNAGVVPLSELADLYSNCDVALVISLTNLSLLPLELMACGCPVVSNRGPNTEWLLNDANAMLVDATPTALADGILRVLQDDELQRRLSVSGKEFAQASSWKTEAEKVIGALEELRNRTPASVTL